jgi:hypothetical protein
MNLEKRAALGLFPVILSVSAILLSCEPLEVSEDPNPDDGPKTSAQAKIEFTNKAEYLPGTYTFIRYHPGSSDPDNGNKLQTLGAVPENGVKTFSVPAGIWKFAYADESETLYPMTDEAGSQLIWYRVQLDSGATYHVRVRTDKDFNRNLWETDFPLLP